MTDDQEEQMTGQIRPQIQTISTIKEHAQVLGIPQYEFSQELPDLVRRGYPVRVVGGKLIATIDGIRDWLSRGDEVMAPTDVRRLLDEVALREADRQARNIARVTRRGALSARGADSHSEAEAE